MKFIVAICLLVVSVSCAPLVDDELNDAWTLFKRVHKRSYASIEEESQR